MLGAGATALNLQSSRSHAIFTIFLQRTMLEPVSERKQVSYERQDLASLSSLSAASHEHLHPAIRGLHLSNNKACSSVPCWIHSEVQADKSPCQHLCNGWLAAVAAGTNTPIYSRNTRLCNT